MCGMLLTVWPPLWMPYYLLGCPPIKCCGSNQCESHLVMVGPHRGDLSLCKKNTVNTTLLHWIQLLQHKQTHAHKHYWHLSKIFALKFSSFLLTLVKNTIKKTNKKTFYTLSPLRSALLARCEGLDRWFLSIEHWDTWVDSMCKAPILSPCPFYVIWLLNREPGAGST